MDTQRAFVVDCGLLISSESLLYGRHYAVVGLEGVYANHALRYTYTQDLCVQHLAGCEGNRAEALADISLELGRGTYVAQVYLR